MKASRSLTVAQIRDSVARFEARYTDRPVIGPKYAVKRPKLTPAWVAHRQNLSDTTSVEQRARRTVRHQAQVSFWKWHDDCQKRKQRREVLAAKKLLGKAAGRQRGKPASIRKPPSRLRCP